MRLEALKRPGQAPATAHKVAAGGIIRAEPGPAIESLSTLTIVYCCVVMVIAYSARGASGFGAAAAMPLLGLVLPLKVLVPAWTLIGIAAGTALLGSDRNKVAWAEIWRARCPARWSASPSVSTCSRCCRPTRWRNGSAGSCWPTASTRCGAPSARRAKPHLPPRIAAALGGIGGGMTGTVVGTMGSVFFAMYFDAIALAKDNYRATMTAILLTLTVIRGVGYFAVGEFSRDVLVVTAILFPSMLIGIFVGNRFHHGMSELAFRRTVACALTVSGLALLIK